MLPKEVPENIKDFFLRFYTIMILAFAEKDSNT